jgi:hypothetical protein
VSYPRESSRVPAPGGREVDRRRLEYSCSSCGYATCVSTPAATCPVCGGSDWSYTGRGGTEGLTVRRIGGSIFVLTPCGALDGPAGAALIEAVAALAHEQPDVVVELAEVRHLDRTAAQLLLRMAALARGAGGRLLAACHGKGEAVELHELDPDRPDTAPEAVGHALRLVSPEPALNEERPT